MNTKFYFPFETTIYSNTIGMEEGESLMSMQGEAESSTQTQSTLLAHEADCTAPSDRDPASHPSSRQLK